MAPDFRFAAAAAASLCLVAAAAQEQELVAFSIASDAVLGSPSGATLSAPGFAPSGAAWTPASAPCTVLACLVQAGAVPGVGLDADALFVGDAIHALVNASAFDSAWWYWTTFSLPARGAPGGGGDYVTLEFNGVGYKADVWLNGALLADKGVVAGSFVYHALDATPLAVWGGGSNTLALRVERQDDRVFGPGATNTTDLGISFVDWSYDDPPDANMGLWRSSFVRVHGAATVRGAGVSTALPPAGPPAPGGGPPATFASANLTVYADVRNFNAAAAATGTLAGRVVSPAGAQLCAFSSRVSVPAGATSLVAVSPAQPGAACLALPAPVALWWPWQMGAPSLHALDLSFTLDGAPDGEPSDALAGQRFGVRTATSALTPAGAREFAVNGVPLLVAGGGWSPDLFQRADGRRLAATLALTRHLGLNAVRLEGKMEPDAFFDAMDELGMLALPGWCCCDAWQNWGVWTDATRAVARASMASQAARLRTHASVLAFLVSSDELPPEAVERLYLDELTAAAWPSFAANVSAASAATSKISGPTGVKMSGPYSWVPPVYWTQDGEAGRRAWGGAWGFLTEGGPGEAPMPIEGIAATLPPGTPLWPPAPTDAWGKAGNPAGNFGSLARFTAPLYARYGNVSGAGAGGPLADFLFKSAAASFEGHRAFVEGYALLKHGPGGGEATGYVQWMLNNDAPSNIWHFILHDLSIGAAGWGASAALGRLAAARDGGGAPHLAYSPAARAVFLVNSRFAPAPDAALFPAGVRATLTALSREDVTLATASAVVPPGAVAANGVLPLPALAPPAPRAGVTFYRLELTDAAPAGALLESSTYWLGEKEDELDYAKSTWYNTPVRAFADLTPLFAPARPAGRVAVSAAWAPVANASALASPAARWLAAGQPGGEGAWTRGTITVANAAGAGVALLVRLRVVRAGAPPPPPGAAAPADPAPLFFDDNFLTLRGGESREVAVEFPDAALGGALPDVAWDLGGSGESE